MAIKVSGGHEAAADLMSLAKKSPRAVERALYKFGNQEMTEAKKRTPVEFGTLRDSGMVDEPRWEGSNAIVELSFGGAASEYAIFVHEDMEAFHAQGQAKFLESTLNESAPHMADRLAAEIEKFIQQGGDLRRV